MRRSPADVVVTEETPDRTFRPIGVTDELPEADYIIPAFVDPEIAQLALSDDIKPLFP